MKAATNKTLACDALWNERQAHFSMRQDVEQNRQDDLRAINVESAKKEADRKRSVNEQFWRGVWVSCNVLLSLIVVYAAFSFGATL